MSTDPGEANTVADKNPEIASRLKNEVVAWRKSMPSTIKVPASNE
jgi:hypothetical protein